MATTAGSGRTPKSSRMPKPVYSGAGMLGTSTPPVMTYEQPVAMPIVSSVAISEVTGA